MDTTEQWNLDWCRKQISHPSGLVLRFQGHPDSASFNITPVNIPTILAARDIARLIREGVGFYEAACKAREQEMVSGHS